MGWSTSNGTRCLTPEGSLAEAGAAEAVRFELTNGCPLPVFKTGALDHSATLPRGSGHATRLATVPQWSITQHPSLINRVGGEACDADADAMNTLCCRECPWSFLIARLARPPRQLNGIAPLRVKM